MTAAEFLEVLKRRRSVRRFRDQSVDPEAIRTVIEAASWAPSAGNRQDWIFTVVTSDDVKTRMKEAVAARWTAILNQNRELGGIEDIERYVDRFGDFASAPVVIGVSCLMPAAVQDHLLGAESCRTSGGATSAAMAAQNLMLAAHALGLGTCCMTGALAAQAELKALLGLDRRQELVCLVTLGIPDETPPPPPRRPVDAITRFLE